MSRVAWASPGKTVTAMMRRSDRIDARIALLAVTRDALDMLIRVNSRHWAGLSAAPDSVVQSA
jgi:hypothetical protein